MDLIFPVLALPSAQRPCGGGIGKGSRESSWEQAFSSNFSVARRLIPLRQLLGSLASSPRVMQCAETVPVLLELFFRVVAEVGPLGGVWLPIVPWGSLVM